MSSAGPQSGPDGASPRVLEKGAKRLGEVRDELGGVLELLRSGASTSDPGDAGRRLRKGVRAVERGVERLRKTRTELEGLRDVVERRGEAGEYGHLRRLRLEHLVEVREPLVLITQIQRSGGTLLSQLLDGHPQLHAHPYELQIGHPNKSVWPVVDPAGSPADWWKVLREARTEILFEQGYHKGSRGLKRLPGEGAEATHPLILPPLLQEELFEARFADGPPESARAILDAYMTSYFNAWLDNQNLYTAEKRWVSGFVPRMNMTEGSLEGFFSAYPDGRLVSIVRDPRAWYASARGQLDTEEPSRRLIEEYSTIESAIGLWKESTAGTIEARSRFGDRVHVVAFEELVAETEQSMRSLAEFLSIRFEESLLVPTFNRLPIKADSSFAVEEHGVLADPLTRYRERLDPAEIGYIENEAVPLYDEALAAAKGH